MIKSTVKSFTKSYSPKSAIKRKKRELPGQQALFDANRLTTLPWLAEKSKLIELIAALSQTHVFGDEISRKELWNRFEQVFEVNLQNAEKSLSQMKSRKIRQTRFLDDLKEAFMELMEKEME